MRQLLFAIVPILVVTMPLLSWINHIHSNNRGIDQTYTTTTPEDGQKLPSTISLFDEKAYQKALEHKGLNETLCSPVMGLKVSEKCTNKGFIKQLDQRSVDLTEENRVEKL